MMSWRMIAIVVGCFGILCTVGLGVSVEMFKERAHDKESAVFLLCRLTVSAREYIPRLDLLIIGEFIHLMPKLRLLVFLFGQNDFYFY